MQTALHAVARFNAFNLFIWQDYITKVVCYWYCYCTILFSS